MNCRSCEATVTSGMSAAMLMNSCPFCGKNIFSQKEFEFRNSVYKILVKNGLENDQTINGIIGDILATFGGQRQAPPRQAPPRQPQQPQEEDLDDVDEVALAEASRRRAAKLRNQRQQTETDLYPDDGSPDLSDAEMSAPSRTGNLRPSPPSPLAKKTAKGSGDAVANAMRAFEEDQDLDRIAPQRRAEVPNESEDAEGVYFMENPKEDEVQRRKQVARAGRPGNGQQRITRADER